MGGTGPGKQVAASQTTTDRITRDTHPSSAPTIQQIQLLRGLPVFADYAPDDDLPQFRQHNLIYGFNGCGKTTLSRVFACLGDRSLHPDWNGDCEYRVQMTDGNVIHPGSDDQSLSSRIFVFNDDFVSKHLRWKEGEASPIFLQLGPQAAELSTQLEDKEADRASIEKRLTKVSDKLRSGEREFGTHKTDRARLIANAIDLARQYNAVRLAGDYDSYAYDAKHILNENDLKAQQDILKQDEPLPKCDRITALSHSMHELIRDTRRLVTQTLGTVSIEVLREHDAMLPWVKTGLEYHKEQHLESCLFCGSELTDVRTATLEAAIDDRYETLVNDVTNASRRAQALVASLAALTSSLPSKNDIVVEQRTAYADAATALTKSIDEGVDHIKAAAGLLERKSIAPNTAITPDGLATDEIASQWETTFSQCLEEINEIIDAHNKAHDEFQQNRDAAKDKIKKHYLADGHEEYRRLETRVTRAKKVKEKREGQRDTINSEIDQIKQQMRQHGPAAEQVNTMIKRYLGHGELELAAKDEGYEIRRHGQPATAPPSEGEKTAIALCYFLVVLEGDGRKRKDLIVVLDDPISSMDTRSLNYACSMIRSLKNVGQLIVLTHNLHVMNDLKKGLKNHTEKRVAERNEREGKNDEPTAALFFIDTIQPNGTASRQSRLVEMPKHLRDYEAEYHYLFNMMLRFLNCENDRGNYFFVMPNVLRKILETFFAFKLPGSDRLSNKVAAIAQKAGDIGIDQARLHALENLAQLESHGDNLDDLMTMSSMTVEETVDAANALLELMEKMDTEHKKRMYKLCKPERVCISPAVVPRSESSELRSPRLLD